MPTLPHPSESRSQQAVVRWWAYAHAGFGLDEFALIAYPAQGARTARNGARMKAEGARAGVPDLLLVAARKGWHSLWIELKTPTGRLSPAQRAFHEMLRRNGHAVEVCRGSEEAQEVIINYLSR